MREAVAATMLVEEETQSVAVEPATAATWLPVDSAGGAATVQSHEEAADATSEGPGWHEKLVDMYLACWKKGSRAGVRRRLTWTPL